MVKLLLFIMQRYFIYLVHKQSCNKYTCNKMYKFSTYLTLKYKSYFLTSRCKRNVFTLVWKLYCEYIIFYCILYICHKNNYQQRIVYTILIFLCKVGLWETLLLEKDTQSQHILRLSWICFLFILQVSVYSIVKDTNNYIKHQLLIPDAHADALDLWYCTSILPCTSSSLFIKVYFLVKLGNY